MWVVEAVGGDHAAAILLSQLLWWFQPAKGTRELRVRYEREGRRWLIRSDDDWYNDCRLTQKQVRRIRSLLVGADLVVHRRFKVGGAPTGAWSPNFEALEAFVAAYESNAQMGSSPPSEAPERAQSNAQMGESISPNGALPISTDLSHRDNTPEEQQLLPVASADELFEEFWLAYPAVRRKAKPDARAAFKVALKKAPAEQIISAARRYTDDPNRVDQYTPYPQKWLKQEEWNAPPELPRNSTHRDGNGLSPAQAKEQRTRQAIDNVFGDKPRIHEIGGGG